MKITDEMVETAAKAMADIDFWDDTNNDLRDDYRREARLALEAAAPLIARAENAACAEMFDGGDVWISNAAAAAIRARHATTPPGEEK